MGKVLNSLRNLGQKMTGVPITSVRVDRVLNEIADNYSGGGGGGGMLEYGCYTVGNNVRYFDMGTYAPIDDSVVYNKAKEVGAENITLLMVGKNEGDFNYYRVGMMRPSNSDYMFYSLYEKDEDGFYGYCVGSVQLMDGGSYFLETQAVEIPIM